MESAFHFLAAHWLAAVVFAIALAVAGKRLLRRRRDLPLLPATLALVAAGALLLPAREAWWVGVGAAGVLFLMLVAVLLSGAWWPPLAWIAAAALLVAAGGLWLNRAGDAFVEMGRSLRSVEFVHPWWLALLALLPVIVLLAGRSLDWRELRRGRSRVLASVVVRHLALRHRGVAGHGAGRAALATAERTRDRPLRP
jgi:hypothetical protein